MPYPYRTRLACWHAWKDERLIDECGRFLTSRICAVLAKISGISDIIDRCCFMPASQYLDITGEKYYAVGFTNMFVMHGQAAAERGNEDALCVRGEVAARGGGSRVAGNALIHQDFEIGGAHPVVEVFSNRVEISNPGGPAYLPVDRFIDGYLSRNERLADLDAALCICEEEEQRYRPWWKRLS